MEVLAMKKRNLFKALTSLALCIVLLAGCSGGANNGDAAGQETGAASQGASDTAPAVDTDTAGNIVKGGDLVAPAGKSLMVLPVDKVADEPVRIAAIAMNTNPFDLSVYQGIEYAQKILVDRNIQVDFVSIKEHNITEYERTIRNCMAAGYDAITCNGFGEQLVPLIAEAAEEGIPFFIFNNPAGDENASMGFWGQSGFDGGSSLGELAVELTGGEGKYAIITGSFNVSGHEDRRKGFRSVADANAGMELIGEYENNDLYEKAYEITTNLLTANPDLACIYITAGGPFGAAKAIEDAGMSGKVVVVCHDWMDETIPYVRSGTISGCLDQDPFNQGYAPIVAAYNYLVGDVTPEKLNMIEGQIATPDNVSELIPE